MRKGGINRVCRVPVQTFRLAPLFLSTENNVNSAEPDLDPPACTIAHHLHPQLYAYV